MQLKYYLLLFIQGHMTSTKQMYTNQVPFIWPDSIKCNALYFTYVTIYHEKLTCTQIS